MLQSKLLAFLRCPEDRSELTPAGEELIRRINGAIRSGRLRNRGGETLEYTIDGGFIRSNGDWLYPVIEGIPILMRDEAISVSQFATVNGS